jgi:hypothetical protein
MDLAVRKPPISRLRARFDYPLSNLARWTAGEMLSRNLATLVGVPMT